MPSADMTQIQLPMWVIEQIRADSKLTSGTWAVIEECIERSVAFTDQVLPCDVKLPPGTVFAKGSKLSGLLLAMNQRENGSAINTTFQ